MGWTWVLVGPGYPGPCHLEGDEVEHRAGADCEDGDTIQGPGSFEDMYAQEIGRK